MPLIISVSPGSANGARVFDFLIQDNTPRSLAGQEVVLERLNIQTGQFETVISSTTANPTVTYSPNIAPNAPVYSNPQTFRARVFGGGGPAETSANNADVTFTAPPAATLSVTPNTDVSVAQQLDFNTTVNNFPLQSGQQYTSGLIYRDLNQNFIGQGSFGFFTQNTRQFFASIEAIFPAAIPPAFFVAARWTFEGITAISNQILVTIAQAPPQPPAIALAINPNESSDPDNESVFSATVQRNGLIVSLAVLIEIFDVNSSSFVPYYGGTIDGVIGGGSLYSETLVTYSPETLPEYFFPSGTCVFRAVLLELNGTVLATSPNTNFNFISIPPPPVLITTPCQPGQNAGDWQKDAFDLGFIPNVPDGENYGKAFPPIRKATEPMPVILPLPFS